MKLIDRESVRRLDDHAACDGDSRTFRNDLLLRLRTLGRARTSSWASDVYEIFGEALVYQFLRQRLGGEYQIAKIPENAHTSPDFRCTWARSSTPVTFYIEIKSLNVVGGGQKLNEDAESAMERAVDIEKQISAGKCVAMAARVQASYRKPGHDPDYDSKSLRCMIERTGAKLAGAFGQKQFDQGPTFAFANMMRFSHMHHGPVALAPKFQGRLGKVTGA